MKALQGFQEAKETTETTEANPAEQSDEAKKTNVDSKTSSKIKKKAWTFFPSASLEESLGRAGGGAGKSWSFLPGESPDQTNLNEGSEREMDRMEFSSVLRPEPGQLLGQVR